MPNLRIVPFPKKTVAATIISKSAAKPKAPSLKIPALTFGKKIAAAATKTPTSNLSKGPSLKIPGLTSGKKLNATSTKSPTSNLSKGPNLKIPGLSGQKVDAELAIVGAEAAKAAVAQGATPAEAAQEAIAAQMDWRASQGQQMPESYYQEDPGPEEGVYYEDEYMPPAPSAAPAPAQAPQPQSGGAYYDDGYEEGYEEGYEDEGYYPEDELIEEEYSEEADEEVEASPHESFWDKLRAFLSGRPKQKKWAGRRNQSKKRFTRLDRDVEEDFPEDEFYDGESALEALEMDLADAAGALGFVDLKVISNQLDRVKDAAVTWPIAMTMLEQGEHAMQNADANSAGLPGEAARATARGKLAWHRNNLQTLAHSNASIYPSSADLRKWVKQAFIEYNAVAEGNAHVKANQAAFFGDVWQSIKDLPTTVGSAVAAGAQWASLGALKGAITSPVGLAVIGGALYLYFRKKSA